MTTHWLYKVQLNLPDNATFVFWSIMESWLFDHIGKKGIKWQVQCVRYREYVFSFTNIEDQTLFALTWC